MISERQRREFAARGVIRVDRLIPDATVAPVRELVLKALEAEGTDGALASRRVRKLTRHTNGLAVFKELVTPGVREAIAALVDGQSVSALPNRPQLLFTPPNASSWVVPHKVWHLDVPRLGEVGLPGVQIFTFVDSVPPGAGATLVVAGSHRLLNDRGRIRSKDVKARLKHEPYFRALLSPSGGDRRHFLDEPGHVGDVELQVVELCGEPGDVYLTDLRLLHTLAPNTSSSPRLMMTQRFFVQATLGQIMGLDPDLADAPAPA